MQGYFCDEETSLYYLQSRYYDATVGRFVNGDHVLFPYFFKAYDSSFNIFTYCCCSPVNGLDANGYLYISYHQLKNYMSSISFAMKYLNGWSQILIVLKFYLPSLLAWVNALPVIGQVLFCLILACVARIALEFAYAYYIKKCGIDISISWKGLAIRFR